jgi:hypothetical protein
MVQKEYRNERLLRKQYIERQRVRFDQILRDSKKRPSKVRQVIEEVINQPASSYYADAFKRLLFIASENSDLLEEDRQLDKYIRALHLVAQFSQQWINEPETWKVRTHNRRKQFASLTRHLFCRYPVPTFMDSAWLRDGEIPTRDAEWFIWVGSGNNIRKADKLPFPLTKMMAHRFLEAPDDLNITEALRWGQVMALGGDDRLARAIIGSNIGLGGTRKEEFWVSVITFFIRHNDMLDMNQVGPMIDYINAQKFVDETVNVNGTFVRRGPPQPGFSMHHRTMDALVTQTEMWHRQLNRSKEVQNLVWQSCGIPGYDRIEGVEGNQRRFVVEEILNSRDLKTEGRSMHHCVYSYARSCHSGRCAIYSMRVGHEKRLTIEVDPKNKQITQARGKYNQASTEQDKRILQAWATKTGLAYGRNAFTRWA